MSDIPALELLFSETIVERLGWLLVHSLWQFALLALLAGIAIRAMRRSSASARYGVLLVALALSVAVPAATWMLLPIDGPDQSASREPLALGQESYATTEPVAGKQILASDSEVEDSTPVFPATSVAHPPLPSVSPPTPANVQLTPMASERANTVHRPWLAWIVAGWILGIALCSLRPLLGWRTLRRLRRLGVSPASDEVLAALNRVSARLGLRRAVRVMQSTLARVPVVVGYMRPLILLPVSLVTNIPIGQLEAILAHELAHVRRHDFIVNLLQTLVETLFFYHPAVWWLSRRIRIEREHCCDDIVVTLLGNRVEYGRALVAIEELRGRSAVLALAAADGSLLSRIRRIAGVGADRNAFTLVGRWPAALLGLVLIGVACAMTMNGNGAGKDDSKKNAEPAEMTSTDTDDPEKIEAKLPDGLRIELVGVSTTPIQWVPDDKRAWWKGDGSPLEKPPLAVGYPLNGSKVDRHALAFRIRGATDKLLSFTGPSPTDGTYVGIGSSWGNGKFTTVIEPTRKLTATTLRIGVSAEPWTTWQYDLDGKLLNDPAMSDTLKELRQSIGILRAGPIEKGVGIWAKPFSTTNSSLKGIVAIELCVIDKNGNEHQSKEVRIELKEEFHQFDVSAAEFARFEYRVRLYLHWLTFENVSLESGHKTEVKVKVDTLPDKVAHLRVRNADGSPAQFNTVVSAQVGFSKSPSVDWVGKPTPEGMVSLFKLPIGKHWLLAAGDSEQRTLFQVKIPADLPIVDQRFRAGPKWVGKNINVKSTVLFDKKDGEVIVVDIQNKTKEALSVSEEDLAMTTESLRGLSPRWTAEFPATKIEAGQTGQLRLNWREWARRGLWAARHESIDEKGWFPALPGKIWVRVNLGNIGSLPVSVADPSREETALKTDIERLQGVWLFEAATAGKQNRLPVVWTSKLTVAGDSFQLPNFLDSKKDLKGKFNLDPTANPKTIDLKIDELDLSGLGAPVKVPAGVMPGIFKLEEDRLTICFNTETDGKRPTRFDTMDETIGKLTLVRAPLGFKEFPKEFTVNVTDQEGKPASGAMLADFMNLEQDSKKKDVKPEWELSNAVKIGTDGMAKVKLDKLHSSRLWVRDAEKKLIAIAAVSPVSLLKNNLDIRLQPECKLVGTIECDQLKKLGRRIDWTGVYLMQDGERVAYSHSLQGKFEFVVPSGAYTLHAYGGDNMNGKDATVKVLPEQRELTVDPIALTASKLVLLRGQPAPELAGVVGWKGNKTTLAELKGKYVLLEFWGFWCGPCVESMPVLIELHEKFADKGLAIIGVHLDIEGEVDTAAKLDDKTAEYKKDLWKGKDLPFPVALSSGKRVGEGEEKTRRGPAEQYGVSSFPTTILIDRDGKVVGRFQAHDAKTACAEIEKLLNAKK